MSEKLRRFSKISPSMSNAQFGYSVCPKSDEEFSVPLAKTLAIPLSAIQTTPQRFGKSVGTKEEKCGPLAGVLENYSADTTTHQCEYDAPQPLVDRRTSDHVAMLSDFKWANNRRSQTPLFDAARQVNVGGGSNGNKSTGFVSSRSEPISLTQLEKDCFIIPIHSIDRFLPAGVPLPPPIDSTDSKQGPLNVLEVSDPKLCVLAHLMSSYEPIEPILESPLSHPIIKQRIAASELLHEVQQGNNALGGMLLANMERTAEFPFISYYVINTQQTDPNIFYTGVRIKSLAKFEPKVTRYTAAHTLDLYSEVASICRPPLCFSQNELGNFKKSLTPSTGYIISVFKVFEGDDGERFERNWLFWTGARSMYRYLPRSVNLRKITLHKSASAKGDKMYLLVCECADLLKNLSGAAVLIPTLRSRLCGYTGLYKPIQTF
uniref:CSON003434 protein n=1 Tax=Culicoides sonorensis TaxID=179676 RepID=A0A336MMJ4_CULSO